MFKRICLCSIFFGFNYGSQVAKVESAVATQVEAVVENNAGSIASALLHAALSYMVAPQPAHVEVVSQAVHSVAAPVSSPVAPAKPAIAKPAVAAVSIESSIGKAALNVAETVAIKSAEKAVCSCCC